MNIQLILLALHRPRQLLRAAAHFLAAAFFSALLLPAAFAQVCAVPGVLGINTVTASGTLLNTYFPGTAAGGASGAAVVGYASGLSRGAVAPIAAGDLVLIIQMQDGTGATTANGPTYAFPAAAAGNYEFARVVSVGTNVLNLSSNLINTYTQNTAAANNQTYQVVRVPQYATLTINAGGSIVPAPWDGTTGGIVVTDVAGAFTNNGSINASYAGFRGNAGLTLAGEAAAVTQTVANFDRVRPDAYAAHGGKGEGTAGTPPRVLNVFASAGVLLTLANGTATNLTTAANGISTTVAFLNTTGRSYNGGSRAAGAPGNAGGGATDSDPAGNSENAGGGGGGNIGAGGVGGDSFNDNAAIGGRGGIAVLSTLANKLVLGGGGGSGSTNNDYGLDTSGGAGGGLIIVKAGTVSGTGLLLADGQGGRAVPTKAGGADCPNNGGNNCDGAGGGGAGGGIVVLASSGTGINASVRGGQGGNVNGTVHGPGGGGGGGYTIASNPLGITSVVLGGVEGLTNVGGTPPTVAKGAGPGAGGSGFAANSATLPANIGGLPVNCLPALTTSKITSTPAATSPINPPGTTTYSIVVSNAAGRGDARGLTLYDPSLPGGTVTFANPPLPSFAISTTPTACALGGRTAVVNPANGATTALTAGTFNLPGGCTLTYTFTVNVPATMPNGTFNNSALAWFIDPSVSTGRTVTAVLPPAAFGLVANTTFGVGGAAVGGSNYDGNLAANIGDDIRIQRSANITITKTNGVTALVAGSTTSYTVTVANLGPADASGALLKDVAVNGLNCTAVACTGASGTAVCPAAAGVTIANLQATPGPGITLTSLPASSSLTFVVTCGVTATGQ